MKEKGGEMDEKEGESKGGRVEITEKGLGRILEKLAVGVI